MKKVYLIPNMITAFGLACGLFVIFKVNMIEPGSGYYDVMVVSALFLLLAAFADFVDGALARAFHAESEFGLMFDSMADAISFGVAPSVLLLKSLSLEPGTWYSFFAAAGATIYSLCGVLRLVRFNIQTIAEKNKKEESTPKKKNFTGLPIPAAAAASIAATLLFLSPVFQSYFVMEQKTKAIILTLLMMFLAYLMVSRLKFPGLKSLHFRVPSFHLAFLSVALAVIVLYGALHYFPFVLTIAAWGYIFISLVLLVVRLIAGRKSKTLEDFEPEEEEEEGD
ncbi:MAG: CDP-alcohol phosphatidyltransferase family protein [Chlamydiota bacterium]